MGLFKAHLYVDPAVNNTYGRLMTVEGPEKQTKWCMCMYVLTKNEWDQICFIQFKKKKTFVLLLMH